MSSDKKHMNGGDLEVGERKFTVGHEETFGGDRYVYCLDYNDGFTGLNVKTIQMVHFPYI